MGGRPDWPRVLRRVDPRMRACGAGVTHVHPLNFPTRYHTCDFQPELVVEKIVAAEELCPPDVFINVNATPAHFPELI